MDTLQPGALLQGGRYKILHVLGQGSFGITYLAERTSLHQKVCIKEFFMRDINTRGADGSLSGLSESSLSVKYAKKFRQEAQNLSSLSHPNIVEVTDLFDENGTCYYVMKYIEGEDLNSYVKHHNCTEAEAVSIIKDIASALQYMHEEKRMLHLDMKPGNVMRRNSDGHISVIDFGLSKYFNEKGEPETSTIIGLGTSGYAPLEQANQSKSGEFLPTIDVYAIGATFFKLLTGETPPNASDVNEDGVPTEMLKAKGVSQAAIDAVCKAMESRKKYRTKSAREFVDMLEADMSEPPIVVEVEVEDETKVTPPVYQPRATRVTPPVYQPQKPKHELFDGVFNVNGVKFKMIKVDGGTFTMGATLEQGSDARSYEKPVHQVTLSSYYIGQTEVTQALWQAVMGSNPSYFKGDNRPVEKVSWNDCQKFIKKLNELTGKNFRLPTEAEWEFAARGGIKSRGYKYSGSNYIDNVTWYYNNSGSTTHAVATKQANELGICDMSGNVWEWCSDWYGSYSSSSQTDPTGPNSGRGRVFRGGSCFNFAVGCRSSYRDGNEPVFSSYGLGLRLAFSE